MFDSEALLVLLAAIINFLVGGVWYAILGKSWARAWQLKPEEIKVKDPKPYLIALIGSLWTSYGLFLMIKHIKPASYTELITIAIGTWLFILVGSGAKHYAFARRKFQAFLIDYLVDLIGIILMCLIIWNY